MKKVMIRRCPSCDGIIARAREVETALSGTSDLNVEVTDGAKGEFTVLVDGHQVSGKNGEELPSADEVETAVKDAAHAGQSV